MKDTLKELLLNPINLGLILIIFAIYTLFLLKYASRKIVAVTLEKVWVVILFLSIIDVTVFPFTKINPKSLAAIEKTLPSAIVQVGIYAYVMFILNSRFRYFLWNTLLIFKNLALGILLVLTELSALWSATPGITLQASTVLLGTAAFAAHISSQYTWEELARFLRWCSTSIALVSIPIALLVPSIGIGTSKPTLQGVLSHPNYLGSLMIMNIILWYIQAVDKPQHRWVSQGLIFWSLIVMILTKSGGAIIIFIILTSLLILINFLKRLSFNQAFLAIMFFLTVGIVATIFITGYVESFLNSLGKDITLTGRTEFWPKVVDAIMQRPWLGYGYKGFWQPWQGRNNPGAFITTILGWVAPHSHNGFLDLAIDLGWVGLGLFMLSFLQNVSMAILYMSRSKLTESALPLIILIFVIMKNLTETGLWGITFDFFLYVLVTVRLNIDILGRSLTGIKV